jgi:hypothetical protein
MQQHSCQHGKEKKTLRLDRYRPSIFESLLRIDPPSRAIKEWILDDEPDLGWFNCPRSSIVPEILMSLTQTRSTSARHGRHLKST